MKNETKKDLVKNIIEYAKELRLPVIRKHIQEEIEEGHKNNLSYEQFLHVLLQNKYDARIENGKLNRIRIAGFPAKKYLEDLKVTELPKDAQEKLPLQPALA